MHTSRDHQLQNVLAIPVAAISVSPGRRTLKQATVDTLAESIDADGFLQPIGVRPDDANVGGFSLVFGLHRLQAHKQLGRDTIEATVLDVDAGDAEAVMHAENLFRTKPDRRGRQRAAADRAARETASHLESSDAIAAESGSASVQAIDEVAAESESASVRETPATETPRPRRPPKGIAGLTSEQYATLVGCGVASDRIKKIAKILDPIRQAKAVSLVESGDSADVAIFIAMAPDGATVETVAARPVDGYKPESEMSDDEWFDFSCGDAAARMTYQAAYKAEAIFYRQTRAARDEFRAKVKGAISRAKDGVKGPLYYAHRRILDVNHPKDWSACAACGGSGHRGDRVRCEKCYGNAFIMTTAAP